ncbi:hypothetical protein KP509_1Z279200 [Ceratopteris richardii]|nr:hypothetical protein KP509_1Z279200 [Ceratopteris richardii]
MYAGWFSRSLGIVSSSCRDEDEALSLTLPCIASGSMEMRPSKACCDGIKELVKSMNLQCMCEIFISAGATASPSLLRSYNRRCSLNVPPNFTCRL